MRIIFSAIFLLFAFNNAQAIGLGIASGSGPEEWEDNNTYDIEQRFSAYIGVVFDTNVAKQSRFNYRLTVAYVENSSYDDGPTYKGITTIHDFGFSLVRRERFKMWLGPQLVLSSFSSIEAQSTDTATYDGTVGQFGLGPVFGMNINFRPPLSLAFKAGYRRSGYAGDVDVTNSGSTTTTEVNSVSFGPFVSISLMFRIRDNF